MQSVQRWLIRSYRLAALAAAAWLIFTANERLRMSEATAVFGLAEARVIFPQAMRLGNRDARRNAQRVLGAQGELLGWALTTSPATDDLIGYSGPSNLLVGVDPQGRVVGVELLWSKDTAVHVNAVRRDARFWSRFIGWRPADESPPTIDAVSGSTLTSLAMAEGVQRRLGGETLSLRFPQPLTLDEIRKIYKYAARVAESDPLPGWCRVFDPHEATLGYVLRTSPQADNVIGYSGPTEALVAISPDRRRVTSVRLRSSYDTPDYVERVQNDRDYLDQLAGRSLAEWAALDFAEAGIEGVSGATQTSYALAEGIRRRAHAELSAAQAAAERSRWRRRDLGLLAIVCGAVLIGFTSLRGRRRWRWWWQLVLIAGFGLWFGDMLSLALLAGWSRHGVPWDVAPALMVLTAVALLAPWGGKRQLYCHHLCPHGAVQEWLGRLPMRHVHLPSRLARGLGHVPAGLLGVAFLTAVMAPQFDLSQLEPFDAWVLQGTAGAALAIAVVGLLASCFVPMAYCRFGCPTGALLKFVRSHGSNEQFGARDWFAAALIVAGAGWLLGGTVLTESKHPQSPANAARIAPTALGGDAFGATWSVAFRESIDDPAGLQSQIDALLERIESQLSHWRPESDAAQFNSSATTLEMECSPDLVFMLDYASRFSRATHGAFDLTVGPLVNAWGYGPAGSQPPPSDADVAALLESTGWQKIVIDRQQNLVRKLHPDVQIDLGALLQGYAADRIAERLDALEISEYLINVGGELRCRGAWTVAIESPRHSAQPLRTVALQDAALATSGVYRTAADGSSETRHIISPQTGRPIESKWKLCAVVAPTAIEADGWATALLASNPDDTLAIARRERLAALLVDDAGEVHTTGNFPRAVVTDR